MYESETGESVMMCLTRLGYKWESNTGVEDLTVQNVFKQGKLQTLLL